MVFLLILFVLAVSLALWLTWNALKLVSWRINLWCFLCLTLLAAVFSGEIVVSPAERVVMALWSGAVVFLPVWWVGRAILRGLKR